MKDIIIIEPILRGSRLQITANLVESLLKLDNYIRIVILTRNKWHTEHFDMLLGNFFDRIKIYSVSTDLNGAWIKTLSLHEWNKFIDSLEEISKTNKFSIVIFMALDDYLFAFSLGVIRLRKIINQSEVFILKYRVEYLLKISKHISIIRWVALNFLTLWCLKLIRGRLICFDERLEKKNLFGIFPQVIPDPWFGAFTPNHRMISRGKLNYCDDDFVLLTLGRQDKRKGFPVLLAALPTLVQNPRFRLLVVGSIDIQWQYDFEIVKNKYQKKINHVNHFVNEDELPMFFSVADAFLLAYSKDFTCTSGTLPRAAASGVPLLACDHGLIGYHMITMGLGETFDSSKPDTLIQAFNKLVSYDEKQLFLVKTNLQKFASSNDLASFNKAISNIFYSILCDNS